MHEMLQHLGQAALQRERADQQDEAEVTRRSPVREQPPHKQPRLREQHPGPAPEPAPQSLPKEQAPHSGAALTFSAPAGGGISDATLESLREAAWGAAADQQAAAGALMAAWVSTGRVLRHMHQRRLKGACQ